MRRLAGPVLLAVLVAAAVLLIPGLRWRGEVLYDRLRGATSDPWREVAVQLAPDRWLEQTRSLVGATAVEWSQSFASFGEVEARTRSTHVSYKIYDGPTPNLNLLDCHYTRLESGQVPHPPHVHDDEEIIVPIEGEVEILRADAAGSENIEAERVGPGRLVYHSPRAPHTIRAVGPEPAGYLVFRWYSPPGASAPSDALEPQTFDFRGGLTATPPDGESRQSTLVFEGPTASLTRLHAHLSFSQPGTGSNPHRDRHDVAIVALEGAVEVPSGRIDAPGVVFHPAGKKHFLNSVGEDPARYLAIEFVKRN